MSENSITVPVCLCEGAHTDETITFRYPVGFRDMAIAQRAITLWRQLGMTLPDVLGRLVEFYLLNLIADWTLVDKKRKPLPVTRENVQARIIDGNPLVALDLADFADDLYAETILRPLVERVFKFSQASPTEDSTSPPPPAQNGISKTSSVTPSGKSPKPSKRSSTSTTQTGAIAAMP